MFARIKAHSRQCFLLCQSKYSIIYLYIRDLHVPVPFHLTIPLYCFILKVHRDFSPNVICAIQAWFIIVTL